MRGVTWRRRLSKSAFLSIYGSPLLQAAVGIDPKDGGRQRAGKDPLHHQLVQQRIAELKSRIIRRRSPRSDRPGTALRWNDKRSS